MTKSELIASIAQKQPHLQAKDVELAISGIIDTLITTLTRDERIEIRGFGAFSTVHYQAKIGRNPKTGETVSVPAKRAIHFKVGLDMRKKVDESRADHPVIRDL